MATGKHAAAAAAEVVDLAPRLLQQQQAWERFDAIVEPLEKRDRTRLGGPGRDRCAAAFFESPDGFARVAEKALVRARSSTIGLLIRLVDDREHLLVATPPERLPTRHLPIDECARCGQRRPLVDELHCRDCAGRPS